MGISVMKSLAKILLLGLTGLGLVEAHGYVKRPQSRQAWCNERANSDFGNRCGWVQYDPMSVEGLEKAPFIRDVGGHLCSGDALFIEGRDMRGVDDYRINWPKTDITQGQDLKVEWEIHAPHETAAWFYYATKKGFTYPKDRNLTKDDFDSAPIARFDHSGPPPDWSWSQTLPGSALGDRTGDVVILAVWDIGDTDKAFYNCIDLNVQPSQGNQQTGASVPFPNYYGSFDLECTFKPKQQQQQSRRSGINWYRQSPKWGT